MGSQVKAMEEARRKAAILKYNKFRLPDINKTNKSKWTATSFQDTAFQIPDGKVMMAPKGNPQRNKKPLPTQSKPSQNNKPTNKPSTHMDMVEVTDFNKKKPNGSKGKKPLTIKPKKTKKTKQNNNNGVPQPTPYQYQGGIGGQQPKPYQYQGGIGGQQPNGAYPKYGQNPVNNWQQQAPLGYGSSPNLSYQQYPQQPNNNGAYQQQQRQQYGQQNKNYYNASYKR